MNHFTNIRTINEMKKLYQRKINHLENELKKQKLMNYNFMINNDTNIYKNTQCFGLILRDQSCSELHKCDSLNDLTELLTEQIIKFLTPHNKTHIYFYWMHDIDPCSVTLDMIMTFGTYVSVAGALHLHKYIIRKLNMLGYDTDHYIFEIIRKYGDVRNISNWEKYLVKIKYKKIAISKKRINLKQMINKLIEYEKYKLKINLENYLYKKSFNEQFQDLDQDL